MLPDYLCEVGVVAQKKLEKESKFIEPHGYGGVNGQFTHSVNKFSALSITDFK